MGANRGAGREVTKLEREIHIDAEPQVVYDTLMDPDCLGEWVSIQVELLEAPEGDLEQGDELVQRAPPYKTVWRGRGRVGSKALVPDGRAGNHGGTDFTDTNEYALPGGPVGRLGGRGVFSASGPEADKTLERLKRLVEN